MSKRLSIDIKGRMIKAVEGKSSKDNAVTIGKVAYLDISGAVLKDDKITNCPENVNLLKNFFSRHKFSTRNVLLSISDAKVIMRVITLPKLSLSDLNNLINIEIPRYFPIDLSRFYIDYRILGLSTEEDKPVYKILLCAIPSEVVKEYVDLLLACNMKPTLVDVHPNSVSRLFQSIEFEDTVIIDAGVDSADILILDRGKFYLYTSFPFEIPEFNELFRNPAEYDIAQMEEQIQKLAKNAQSYFDFYLSTHEGKNIDKIFVTGDLALVRGVQEKLQEALKVETLTGFDKFIEIKKSRKSADINENFIDGNIGVLLRGV